MIKQSSMSFLVAYEFYAIFTDQRICFKKVSHLNIFPVFSYDCLFHELYYQKTKSLLLLFIILFFFLNELLLLHDQNIFMSQFTLQCQNNFLIIHGTTLTIFVSYSINLILILS